MESTDKKIGKFFLRLFSENDWISRRVERVEYLDFDGTRRDISLDIDISRLLSIADECGLKNSTHLPIPLGLVDKSLYLEFDIKDSQGISQSLYTSDENAAIATEVLLAVIEDEGFNAEGLHDGIKKHIKSIARGGLSPEERKAFREAEEGKGSQIDSWMIPQDLVSEEHVWLNLFTREKIVSWFIVFTRSFMPIIKIPTNGTDGRSLLKYGYLEYNDSNRETELFRSALSYSRRNEEGYWANWLEALIHAYRVLPERLAIKPRPLFLTVDGIGMSSRDHVRVNAPPGVFFTELAFGPYAESSPAQEISNSDAAANDTEQSQAPVRPRSSWQEYSCRIAPETAVVYFRNIPRHAWEIELYWRPKLEGFILPSIVACMSGVFLLMGGGIAQLFGKFLETRMYSQDGLSNSAGAAVAIMLLVPTLFAATLARPGDHQVRAEALFWPRVVVGFSGLATALAAVSVVIGLKGLLLATIWILLGSICLIVATILAWARHCEKLDFMAVVGASADTDIRKITLPS
ncbi:hypothetical protein [Kocuria sp. UCD-OTCP]|uniref:hypothetical protein n=1 Tax=Kocuria sp. UCD-OTCP TaxID=1292021 RepID=UPI0012371D3C|nr:hypothetical protein [Kocuria sp. UCD-OTCP]